MDDLPSPNRPTPEAAPAEGGADPLLREHALMIRNNPLLHAIYCDVYARLMAELPPEQFAQVVEIGSGAGFLKQVAPQVTTTDCVAGAGIDQVVDACRLPDHFPAGSLDAIVGFDVFHHLPDVVGFLIGVEAVLRPGGRLVLVEPWFTPLGQWFYRALHHEPVLLDPEAWRIEGEGRLGGANSRLPTSVFRDGQRRLARVAPGLAVLHCTPFHKWLYLVSGGLRLNTRVPGRVARLLLRMDRATSRLDSLLGIFAVIVVERRQE